MSSHPPSSLSARLQAHRARHRARPRAVRALVTALGGLVTFAGLLLLVLPGPALVVIPVGLALLALEFGWAERALVHTLDRAEAARRRAAVPRLRVAAALGVVAAAAVVAAVLGAVPF